MTGLRRKKRIVRAGLLSVLFFLMLFGFLYTSIPDRFLMTEGKEADSFLSLPLVKEEVVKAGAQDDSNIPEGAVTVNYSFLGIIPMKSVEVTMVDEKKVFPGGMPVGIYMKTDGILVVGTGTVEGMDGKEYSPASNILKSGDYIRAVNGTAVNEKEDLISCVNHCLGSDVVLSVERNGEVSSIKVSPTQTGREEYKLGIWVRDDTQGIGTVTYMDGDGNYGALGHGISDVDTGLLMKLDGGNLYHTEILSLVKGEKGNPGEMTGVIRYRNSEILGTITENTDQGIFGKITRQKEAFAVGEPVEIAYKQEITAGPATILSAVDGTVKEYSIEIEKINLNSREANKSMVIRVTDEELLEKTGGIIQGMSGSPILQNGKLIGAVTHVFVQDSARGYGIFIEHMLEH